MEVIKVMMKKLCRIRLINWHYFINETIEVNGSFLISGENTSGKSTLLDAIQLVLTTNTRKFNTAANEKSKRDLKGYVRCKIGNENNTYLRKGSVITYVALEFYEEKTSKYFTLGVKIDSPDEESKLSTKWFRQEARFEDLSFTTDDNRPSTTEEFRKDNKKVQLIPQSSGARQQFSQRLGFLEDRFFDMIPKSLAFKPMDNIKDFINKFILSEKNIEVESLRSNITTLKELEDLMDITKEKTMHLKEILDKNGKITLSQDAIKTNEILIQKAEIESSKIKYNHLKKTELRDQQALITEQKNNKILKSSRDHEHTRLTNLKVSLQENETTQLIQATKHAIEMLEKDRHNESSNCEKLDSMIFKINQALTLLNQHDIYIISKEELLKLNSADVDIEEKIQTSILLKEKFDQLLEGYRNSLYEAKSSLKEFNTQKLHVETTIRNLENKKLTYPENTLKLKEAIENGFLSHGIESKVRIFSELLEITDPKWQNAIEGYLNTQRFYIIVEPQHYEIALGIYNKIKKEVHTVGLVNTGKLAATQQANTDSLAYLITSHNQWARSYAIYLLNRVIRCESVETLKNHKVSITPECMIYQNYAVRKINQAIYSTPFIGAHAYKTQLQNKQDELHNLNEEIKRCNNSLAQYNQLVDKIGLFRYDVLSEYLNSPNQLQKINQHISTETTNLQQAEANPTYIEIKLQIDQCYNSFTAKDDSYIESIKQIEQLKSQLKTNAQHITSMKNLILTLENDFDTICNADAQIAHLGITKFNQQIQIKSLEVIIKNYSAQVQKLQTIHENLIDELINHQTQYCRIYNCDLGFGHEQMYEYINEHHKLISSELIKYEDDLEKAKKRCQLEFRESFLAQLKENIENAKLEFKNLNKALKGIYYGEDSYKFELTYNKKKESIYQMITSNNNQGGFTLWSTSFEVEYQQEIEDLFSKLTAYDDQGEKVVEEYTDYRSYLDYDIIVEKKDATRQKFSKIYGEKSGGETQTPYYVAIAASFVQLYKLGDTIRIMMLDEAFDKMDDDRICAMMDFFNSQNFQIILATPPAKMEVIGEKVDTVLVAIREGTTSIVEEYDL